MYNQTGVKFHKTKPINPSDGDTFYDKSDNSVHTYSTGTWMRYQLYQSHTLNIDRKSKIEKILKSIKP